MSEQLLIGAAVILGLMWGGHLADKYAAAALRAGKGPRSASRSEVERLREANPHLGDRL